jgi:hypothetical protein
VFEELLKSVEGFPGMPLYEGIGLINEKLPVVLEIGQALTKYVPLSQPST